MREGGDAFIEYARNAVKHTVDCLVRLVRQIAFDLGRRKFHGVVGVFHRFTGSCKHLGGNDARLALCLLAHRIDRSEELRRDGKAAGKLLRGLRFQFALTLQFFDPSAETFDLLLIFLLPLQNKLAALLHIGCPLAHGLLRLVNRLAALLVGFALALRITCLLDRSDDILMARHVAVPCLLIRAAGLLCLLHILHACVKVVGDAAQFFCGIVVQ